MPFKITVAPHEYYTVDPKIVTRAQAENSFYTLLQDLINHRQVDLIIEEVPEDIDV